MAQRLPPPAGDIEFSDLDLHFGRLMTRLAQADRAELALAASLASRATGNGDVCVNLSEFAGRPVAALDVTAPALESWIRSLRASEVVGAEGDFRPLVLDDAGRLYLYRYWDYEKRLADQLLARATDAGDIDRKLLDKGLARYFPDPQDLEQKRAAAMAVRRRLCVISGGPGTGKTTTVVKIIALLAEQARERKLAIGLAAPTGKAAARVQDAIHAALDRLALDEKARASIPPEAYTIHRLLGVRPDTIHPRHHRDNPLALDVLVVDEASMADLALATKLCEALPSRARLILLGDKDQLASVEAGAVLGDICAGSALSESIALLTRSYRFGPDSGIGTLARLVNAGSGDEALTLLESGAHEDVAWRTITAADLRVPLAQAAVEQLRAYFGAVRANETPEKLFELFGRFRVLCAHRSGPFGIAAANRVIEDALEDARLIGARQPWYAGRPVMITRNDYGLKLYNGDVGLALPDPENEGRLKVYFSGAGEGVRAYAPARLPEHETVYAMTVHKAQGSEFASVLMILPAEPSPIMSRELVYTGITRAMKRVEIWGSAAVFAEAVARPLARASALRERLPGG